MRKVIGIDGRPYFVDDETGEVYNEAVGREKQVADIVAKQDAERARAAAQRNVEASVAPPLGPEIKDSRPFRDTVSRLRAPMVDTTVPPIMGIAGTGVQNLMDITNAVTGQNVQQETSPLTRTVGEYVLLGKGAAARLLSNARQIPEGQYPPAMQAEQEQILAQTPGAGLVQEIRANDQIPVQDRYGSLGLGGAMTTVATEVAPYAAAEAIPGMSAINSRIRASLVTIGRWLNAKTGVNLTEAASGALSGIGRGIAPVAAGRLIQKPDADLEDIAKMELLAAPVTGLVGAAGGMMTGAKMRSLEAERKAGQLAVGERNIIRQQQNMDMRAQAAHQDAMNSPEVLQANIEAQIRAGQPQAAEAFAEGGQAPVLDQAAYRAAQQRRMAAENGGDFYKAQNEFAQNEIDAARLAGDESAGVLADMPRGEFTPYTGPSDDQKLARLLARQRWNETAALPENIRGRVQAQLMKKYVDDIPPLPAWMMDLENKAKSFVGDESGSAPVPEWATPTAPSRPTYGRPADQRPILPIPQPIRHAMETFLGNWKTVLAETLDPLKGHLWSAATAAARRYVGTMKRITNIWDTEANKLSDPARDVLLNTVPKVNADMASIIPDTMSDPLYDAARNLYPNLRPAEVQKIAQEAYKQASLELRLTNEAYQSALNFTDELLAKLNPERDGDLIASLTKAREETLIAQERWSKTPHISLRRNQPGTDRPAEQMLVVKTPGDMQWQEGVSSNPAQAQARLDEVLELARRGGSLEEPLTGRSVPLAHPEVPGVDQTISLVPASEFKPNTKAAGVEAEDLVSALALRIKQLGADNPAEEAELSNLSTVLKSLSERSGDMGWHRGKYVPGAFVNGVSKPIVDMMGDSTKNISRVVARQTFINKDVADILKAFNVMIEESGHDAAQLRELQLSKKELIQYARHLVGGESGGPDKLDAILSQWATWKYLAFKLTTAFDNGMTPWIYGAPGIAKLYGASLWDIEKNMTRSVPTVARMVKNPETMRLLPDPVQREVFMKLNDMGFFDTSAWTTDAAKKTLMEIAKDIAKNPKNVVKDTLDISMRFFKVTEQSSRMLMTKAILDEEIAAAARAGQRLVVDDALIGRIQDRVTMFTGDTKLIDPWRLLLRGDNVGAWARATSPMMGWATQMMNNYFTLGRGYTIPALGLSLMWGGLRVLSPIWKAAAAITSYASRYSGADPIKTGSSLNTPLELMKPGFINDILRGGASNFIPAAINALTGSDVSNPSGSQFPTISPMSVTWPAVFSAVQDVYSSVKEGNLSGTVKDIFLPNSIRRAWEFAGDKDKKTINMPALSKWVSAALLAAGFVQNKKERERLVKQMVWHMMNSAPKATERDRAAIRPILKRKAGAR